VLVYLLEQEGALETQLVDAAGLAQDAQAVQVV
jgi:hypothetical protein